MGQALTRIQPNDLVLRERRHQTLVREAERRFNVLVWHRRAGKSFHLVSRMLARAVQSGRGDWQAAFVAPTRLQGQQIAEPYLRQLSTPLGGSYMPSRMELTLPGVGWIRIFSGENYERMRGLFLDDVVFDEAAHIPSAAWTQVVSPAIADRRGGATFSGTPRGMANLLWEQLEYAQTSGDPEWAHSVQTYRDTGALDPKEIERMRRSMTPEEFGQELECSFEGALRGAFHARDMADAMAQGRVTEVRYDAALPVRMALDLGWSDAMVAIAFQMAGTEVRILDCSTYHQTGIPDMVAEWRDRPYRIDSAILPHDARVSELGSGKSRQEVFHSLGIRTSICPNQRIHEGISAVRLLFPHVWFNRDTTQTLREALQSYRSEFDEVRRVHNTSPLHDWSSHYADAMRYLALGRPGLSASSGGWADNSHLMGGLI